MNCRSIRPRPPRAASAGSGSPIRSISIPTSLFFFQILRQRTSIRHQNKQVRHQPKNALTNDKSSAVDIQYNSACVRPWPIRGADHELSTMQNEHANRTRRGVLSLIGTVSGGAAMRHKIGWRGLGALPGILPANKLAV